MRLARPKLAMLIMSYIECTFFLNWNLFPLEYCVQQNSFLYKLTKFSQQSISFILLVTFHFPEIFVCSLNGGRWHMVLRYQCPLSRPPPSYMYSPMHWATFQYIQLHFNASFWRRPPSYLYMDSTAVYFKEGHEGSRASEHHSMLSNALHTTWRVT